jgi:hypothetical protein
MSIVDQIKSAAILGLAKNPVVITGTLGAGNVLTASLRAGFSATGFQWTSNGSDISGQTANTYTQLTTDRGSVIGCRAIGLAYAGSAGTVPVAVPGVPTGLTATAGNGQISGVAIAPADNGGAAITGYQMPVYRASDNVLLGTAAGAAPNLTLTGIANGVAVYVKMAAVNSVGVGPLTAASNIVTPAAGPAVTSAPTINSEPRVYELLDATPATFSGADTVVSSVYADGVLQGPLPFRVTIACINKTLTVLSVGTNSSGSTPSSSSGSQCRPVLSASKRTVLSPSVSTAGTNNVRTSRLGDISNETVVDPFFEIWNGWVDASATTVAGEKGVGNVVPYRLALLLNLNGISQDQSSATQYLPTWFKAAAGNSGYLYKLDGSEATAAEFTAAGGLLSGDGYTITMPDGWRANSDRLTGVTIVKNTRYMVVSECAPAVGAKYPSGVVSSGRADLGDMNKDATFSNAITVKNWTTLSGVATGSVIAAPCNVYGFGTFGKKTVTAGGDSIARENHDSQTPTGVLYGDADGCCAFLNRALNIGGYNWTRAAVSGTSATNVAKNGGYAQRALQGRFADADICNMGNNDRGLPWLGAAGTGLYQTLRFLWATIRNYRKNGSTSAICAVTFPPQATSTDLWATTANQTVTYLSTAAGNANYRPFLNAGVFGAGDCTAGYDMYAALYAAATAAGFTDIVDLKIPANGTAQAGYFDSTHQQAVLHAGVASDMASKMPALIGF